MTPLPPRFILASSSPRRRELLAAFGLQFEVIKPEVDETQHPDEPPYDYVQRLSQLKAATVAAQLDAPALVLAADTIVVLDADIIGKPGDAAEARAMLQRLRGRAHIVATSFTLMNTSTQATLTKLTTTQVHMRSYDDAEIEAYIATGDPFDKAGGYAIQHGGFHPVGRIEGSYDNVMGLPLEALEAALKAWGVV